MCGGFVGGIVDTIKGLVGGETKAEKKAKKARAALAAEEAAINEREEIKRKQRKATATVLTSGQGLGIEQGETLGE